MHDLEHALGPRQGRAGDARPGRRGRTRRASAHQSARSLATPRSGRRARPPSAAPPDSPPCRNSRRRGTRASPVCTPIRTRNGPVSPHDSARQRELRRHRRGDARRAPSRTPRGTRRPSSSPHDPRCARSRRAGSRRGAPSAGRIASGCSSHRRVEPSRSVNKNVTVPDGNSATRPLLDRSRDAASKPGKPDDRHPPGEPHSCNGTAGSRPGLMRGSSTITLMDGATWTRGAGRVRDQNASWGV